MQTPRLFLGLILVVTLSEVCDGLGVLIPIPGTTNACINAFQPIPAGGNICAAVCAATCTFNFVETASTFPRILFRCNCANNVAPPNNLVFQNFLNIACSTVDVQRQCICPAGQNARRCTLSVFGILDPFHIFCTCGNAAKKEIIISGNSAMIEEAQNNDSVVEVDKEIQTADQAVMADKDIGCADQTVVIKEIETADQTVVVDNEIEAAGQTVVFDSEIETPAQTVVVNDEVEAVDQTVVVNEEVETAGQTVVVDKKVETV